MFYCFSIISSSPATVKRKNKDGNLPLHIALDTEDPSPYVITHLLQAYPDATKVRNSSGFLPLFQACRKPKVHPSIVKSLLAYYPQAAAMKTYGSTPLHMLTHTGGGSPESIKHLLSTNPELAMTKNNFGNIPLHYLCVASTHSSESVQLLLSAYPDGASCKNKIGESPLSRAMARWQNNPSDTVTATGLRLLLYVAKASKLHGMELRALRDLNWSFRRELVMCYALGSVATQTADTSSYVDGSSGIVCEPSQVHVHGGGNKQYDDLALFSYCVSRISCPIIWELIIAYI